MLVAAVMTGVVDYVAMRVVCFVGLKVVERLGAMIGQRTVITMPRIVAVVYVTDEPTRAVKPGAGSDEDSADEPVGTVIAVRSAWVGGIVEITIRTHRRDPDVDGNLSRRYGCTADKGSR